MSEFKKWTPTDAQREVLLALKEESEKFEPPQTRPNVEQFCRDYATFSAGKFSKIMDVLDVKRDRSYFDDVKNPEALMDELADWLDKLPAMRLAREKRTGLKLHKLSKFRAVAVAVRECVNAVSADRVVKYICPTGGSKTTLGHYLQAEFKNELAVALVESREAWRPATRDQRQRAKFTVLLDIAGAFGLRNVDRSQGVPGIEDELIKYCTQTKRLLFIDEAEFFSAYALNLVKLLLNKSRVIIVIACTPRAHAKWNSWYADEADQISRRTHAVVSVSADDLHEDVIKHTIADAALFFPTGQFANADASLKYIVEQAWTFGHYDTIARLAKLLEKTTGAERQEVEDAVGKALKQMAKERAGSLRRATT